MCKALKIISIKSRSWIRSLLNTVLFSLFLFSCASLHTKPPEEPVRLTDREVDYQKGLALSNTGKFAESIPFLLKVTQTEQGPNDEIYKSALWYLAVNYEKTGEFGKAILSLREIEERKPVILSEFAVKTALVKNYIRVENKPLAMKIQKEIDESYPPRTYSVDEIYKVLEENTDFNYDHLLIEELQFLGELQKYFIFVMESPNDEFNKKATDLLISLYTGFLKKLNNDTLNPDFKRNLCIELLDQLRKFDAYKLRTGNVNPDTISKFSQFSEEKQKYLTDWLHR
jgi:tetratricopeptide (TPR) repeat protein